MRVDPEGIYLRLEPGATLINFKTGATRTTPCVELHWKSGRKWVCQSFIGSDAAPTLAAILVHVAAWLQSHDNIGVALTSLEVKS